MLDIIIVGAGGFGRELHSMLGDVFSPEQYRFKGFLAADDPGLQQWGIDAPVLGDPEHYAPASDDRFLLAIGYMDVRRRVVEAIEGKGGTFETFAHPKAQIATTAEIGSGAVIYPLATVSNQAKLAPHVHLNYYASVGHDCRVGRYCLLAPYGTLNGFVALEDEVYISTHGTVAPGRTMRHGSKLSANSACMQDAEPNAFVFGVPGRHVQKLNA